MLPLDLLLEKLRGLSLIHIFKKIKGDPEFMAGVQEAKVQNNISTEDTPDDPEINHLPDHPPQFLWKTWNLKYQFPLLANQQISCLLYTSILPVVPFRMKCRYGKEFTNPAHRYSFDLDLFGKMCIRDSFLAIYSEYTIHFYPFESSSNVFSSYLQMASL